MLLRRLLSPASQAPRDSHVRGIALLHPWRRAHRGPPREALRQGAARALDEMEDAEELAQARKIVHLEDALECVTQKYEKAQEHIVALRQELVATRAQTPAPADAASGARNHTEELAQKDGIIAELRQQVAEQQAALDAMSLERDTAVEAVTALQRNFNRLAQACGVLEQRERDARKIITRLRGERKQAWDELRKLRASQLRWLADRRALLASIRAYKQTARGPDSERDETPHVAGLRERDRNLGHMLRLGEGAAAQTAALPGPADPPAGTAGAAAGAAAAGAAAFEAASAADTGDLSEETEGAVEQEKFLEEPNEGQASTSTQQEAGGSSSTITSSSSSNHAVRAGQLAGGAQTATAVADAEQANQAAAAAEEITDGLEAARDQALPDIAAVIEHEKGLADEVDQVAHQLADHSAGVAAGAPAAAAAGAAAAAPAADAAIAGEETDAAAQQEEPAEDQASTSAQRAAGAASRSSNPTSSRSHDAGHADQLAVAEEAAGAAAGLEQAAVAAAATEEDASEEAAEPVPHDGAPPPPQQQQQHHHHHQRQDVAAALPLPVDELEEKLGEVWGTVTQTQRRHPPLICCVYEGDWRRVYNRSGLVANVRQLTLRIPRPDPAAGVVGWGIMSRELADDTYKTLKFAVQAGRYEHESATGSWEQQGIVYVQLAGFLPDELQASHPHTAAIYWLKPTPGRGGHGELWSDLNGYDAAFEAVAGAEVAIAHHMLELLLAVRQAAGNMVAHGNEIKKWRAGRRAGYFGEADQAGVRQALSALRMATARGPGGATPLPVDFSDVRL